MDHFSNNFTTHLNTYVLKIDDIFGVISHTSRKLSYKENLTCLATIKKSVFFQEKNYGFLSIIFEESIFEIQMRIYHGKNVKNKTDFLFTKNSLFRMVILIKCIFSQEK